MAANTLYEMKNRLSLTWALAVGVLLLAHPLTGDGSIVKMSFLRSVTEGGNVAFGCVDGRTNKPVNVLRWEHNEKPIRPCSRVRISPPGTYHKLLIRPALMSDAGRYECVTEINGTVYRASRTISILAQDIVVYPSNVTFAVVGANVTLRCDGELYEMILWSKNGTYVKTHRIGVGYNGSEFFIRNVTWAHNGTYKCTYFASNRRVMSQAVQLVIVEASSRTTSYTWTIPTATAAQLPSSATMVGARSSTGDSSTPATTTVESASSAQFSRSRAPTTISSFVSFRTTNDIQSRSSAKAIPTTSSLLPLTTAVNPNSLTTQVVTDSSSVTTSYPSLSCSSSKDTYEVSSWMMAVLAVCGTLGVVGFLLIGISLCMWRYKTTTAPSSQSKHRLNIRNPTYSLTNLDREDAAQRGDAIDNCNTGFGQYDTVAGEGNNTQRNPQLRPDRDSRGYVVVKACCRGDGSSNGSLVPATATGYMPMASNPTNNGHDRVDVCKQCRSPRPAYANADQNQG